MARVLRGWAVLELATLAVATSALAGFGTSCTPGDPGSRSEEVRKVEGAVRTCGCAPAGTCGQGAYQLCSAPPGSMDTCLLRCLLGEEACMVAAVGDACQAPKGVVLPNGLSCQMQGSDALPACVYSNCTAAQCWTLDSTGGRISCVNGSESPGTCGTGARMCLDCDDRNACTNDTCKSGICQHQNNAVTCDDGNPCTTRDQCTNGACSGEPMDGQSCLLNTQAGTCLGTECCTGCIDKNAGKCVVVPSPTACGTAGAVCMVCDDGDVCDGQETCAAGLCVLGQKLDCNDGNPCTDDTCNPTSGCARTATPGISCDDGNSCTVDDLCTEAAACVGNPLTCAPPEPCHDPGTCDPAVGRCVYPTWLDGKTCDDGNPCTDSDQCTGGLCRGVGVICDDQNPCTQDSCSNDSCSTTILQDGVDCVIPGNLCMVNQTCLAGQCQGGQTLNCDDGDPCTADTCDPQIGCDHTISPGASCNDRNPCTTDLCDDQGKCAGTAVPCASPDECHGAGVCNPDTGVCTNPIKPNGTLCFASLGECVDGVCTPRGAGGAGGAAGAPGTAGTPAGGAVSTSGASSTGGTPTLAGAGGAASLGGGPAGGASAVAGEGGGLAVGGAVASSGGSGQVAGAGVLPPSEVFVREPGGCACHAVAGDGRARPTYWAWLGLVLFTLRRRSRLWPQAR